MQELTDQGRLGCAGAEHAAADATAARGDTAAACSCSATGRRAGCGAASSSGSRCRGCSADGPPAAGNMSGRGTPPPPPPPPPAVMPKPVTPIVSAIAPSPDPRVHLKAGRWDAEQAAWNMRMLSTTPPTGKTLGATHSDLAFTGNYAVQGNYNGFEIYDISNPAKPVLANSYLCPASQNDVSVYRNLVFMSSESTNSRADCGFDGVPEPVSKTRVRGIRVFDIADVKHPKLVTTVQTCRGSHTHTVVTQAGNDNDVFIYVSGTAGVRSPDEVAGCTDGDINDPNTARFRLEVIKVPLRTPIQAAIVSSPRIFQDLPVPPKSEERDASDTRDREAAAAAAAAAGRATGRGGPDAGRPAGADAATRRRPVPISATTSRSIPELGLAGGACAGLGLLLDIRDPAHPVRLDAAADANMSFWHSATFSNDGKKMLFTDEWGGGGQPRCRSTDKKEWGADALFTIENNKLTFHSYYKLPAAQSVARELRRAQRLARPDSRPRHHGAVVVSGRPVGLRLDRHRSPEGDCLLRSRSGRRRRAWRWAAPGPPTGTTASSSAPRSRADSTSTSWCRAA